MRGFLVGFMVCCCVFMLMGLKGNIKPVTMNEIDPKEWGNNMEILFNQVQNRKFRVELTTPTLNAIKSNEILFVFSNGALNLMTKQDDRIWKVALSSR